MFLGLKITGENQEALVKSAVHDWVTENVEGFFDPSAACSFHFGEMASFSETYLNPPSRSLERRVQAEPVLRRILRSMEDCPPCRRLLGPEALPRIRVSSRRSPGSSPEIAVHVICTRGEQGHWVCEYEADVKRKVLLLGDASAKKNEVVRAAVYDEYDDSWRDSLGAKVMTRHETVIVPEQVVSFHIVFTVWDIAGRRFANKNLLGDYFRGAKAIVAVCDLDENRSMEELGYWLAVARRGLGKHPLVIVARARKQADPLPINEARLKELMETHHAEVLLTPREGSATIEHLFHSLGEDTIRDVFGTRWWVSIYR